MEEKDFLKVAKRIESAQYNIGKLGIFKYDTLDEADPRLERIRTNVTIEIGGPSTHIGLTVLTRKEHTQIKDVVTNILNDRLQNAQLELDALCVERANKNA